jgi:hypothetical protein
MSLITNFSALHIQIFNLKFQTPVEIIQLDPCMKIFRDQILLFLWTKNHCYWVMNFLLVRKLGKQF